MRLVEQARVIEAQRNLVGIEVAAIAAGGEFIVGERLKIKNLDITLNSSGFQQEHSSPLASVLLRNPSSLKI